MKAVVITGKKELSVVNIAQPQPDGKKVIVKVSLVGICGSDIHMWEAGEPKGLIMGHEFSGVVADPGERKDLQVGDRVTVIPCGPCGNCPACKQDIINMCESGFADVLGMGIPGAYAEYVAARPDMVRKLPDNITDKEAAMLEPVAVGLRAIRMASVKPGDKVLITGGGVIGAVCAMWARKSGARYVALSEINKDRAENVLKIGYVDEIFDGRDEQLVPKLLEASGGGFDHGFDCTAVGPAINTCAQALKTHSNLILVGVEFTGGIRMDTLIWTLKELKVLTTLAHNKEMDVCLDILTKKTLDINVESFVDETVDLEKAQETFKRLSSGVGPEIKILLKP